MDGPGFILIAAHCGEKFPFGSDIRDSIEDNVELNRQNHQHPRFREFRYNQCS